jgi:hypothetical protein
VGGGGGGSDNWDFQKICLRFPKIWPFRKSPKGLANQIFSKVKRLKLQVVLVKKFSNSITPNPFSLEQKN